jgi:hypothetical protein
VEELVILVRIFEPTHTNTWQIICLTSKFIIFTLLIKISKISLCNVFRISINMKIVSSSGYISPSSEDNHITGHILLEHYVCKLGHAVVQLVEALNYKPEDLGFYFRWCHCSFSLTKYFRTHYGPGVGSASNRNVYQEYLLGG